MPSIVELFKPKKTQLPTLHHPRRTNNIVVVESLIEGQWDFMILFIFTKLSNICWWAFLDRKIKNAGHGTIGIHISLPAFILAFSFSFSFSFSGLCFFFTTSTIVTTTFVFPRKLDCPFPYSTGFSGMPYMPIFYVSVFSFWNNSSLGFDF